MQDDTECLLDSVGEIGLGILVADTGKPARVAFDILVRMVEMSGGRRVCLCFGNWDDDPRELYDIPEVQRWCREFIELGGLSMLDRLGDMPVGMQQVPSQFLVVACAGMPGTERVGPTQFSYNPLRIAQLERAYCS